MGIQLENAVSKSLDIVEVVSDEESQISLPGVETPLCSMIRVAHVDGVLTAGIPQAQVALDDLVQWHGLPGSPGFVISLEASHPFVFETLGERSAGAVVAADTASSATPAGVPEDAESFRSGCEHFVRVSIDSNRAWVGQEVRYWLSDESKPGGLGHLMSVIIRPPRGPHQMLAETLVVRPPRSGQPQR